MPRLTERLDVATVTARVLNLPKGKKRGAAVGFCGGDPVASVDSSQSASPFRWVQGAPQLVSFNDIKKIAANGASETQIAGYWSTPKGDTRALVWTVDGAGVTGVELHPADWQKSAATGCGDGRQIGYGYRNFVKDPSRALLWSGTRESLIVLTGPDAARDAYGSAVCGGVQVGHVGGSGSQHACLWRGTTESFVDLHPGRSDARGSEALGLDDQQQVGLIWNENAHCEAALWTGAADSYVNLAPEGFLRSRASRCAHGLQIGWIAKEGRGMLLRAVLWNGSADDYLDLQDFLADPWNASWPTDLYVDGDRLRILGTAQQVIRQDKYEMDGGKVPVLWEITLRETIARRPTIAAAPVAAAAAGSAPASDDELIAAVASAFAQAIVDGDYEAAHAQLAPWLQREISPDTLQRVLTRELIDGVAATDFSTSGNATTLQDLREHYTEYHQDDRGRTFSSVDSFGDWGQPSIYVADQITPENFKQWMAIEFTPDPDNEAGIDYCLRLWMVVVSIDGTMRIGHLEPSE
jgi:hypothetical protein